MRVSETQPAVAPVGLGEVRAYLRIDGAAEDALLAGLVRSATALCEAFTGLALIERPVSELVRADGQWQRLARAPVAGIDGVDLVGEDGTGTPLGADAWAAQLTPDGE
ncbi:MAG: head-tail connector protein, partial [Sphingomonadaceae bacterium]